VPPALAIDRLTVRFGAVTAVDALTLEAHAGEVLALLGHNGAGKTTTVRAANGLAEASGGTVRVLGLSPTADGATLRRRTAVLTDVPGLDERLTPPEVLAFAADVYGVPRGEVKARIAALLEEFGLAERAGDRVGGFSRGMRQRLALARALLHRPDLLFLDEPTTALDPAAARQLYGVIRRLAREEGRTVVLCTHNLPEAEALADRVAVLARGRLLALDTPDALAHAAQGSARVSLEVHPDDGDAASAAVAADAALGASARATGPGALRVEPLARERVPRLVATLAAAGVRVYRVAPERPTLADAYFALQPELARAAGVAPAREAA
jgi:ABC-2 type transport system ATP-binding protein